jgi:hypothetical protein
MKAAAPLLHTPVEAAGLLSIARTQLYELLDAGALDWVDTKVKPGGRTRIRISHDAIERFIKNRTRKAKV